ncbi:PP2C family protein-serine/threonine phosphatase [Solirubrobacter soli]|uniref:PP2C family protein-serine/threonine phosphatase n=1 Tax=Solirubrobacter soli TaxID=363832 RepID=UPI0004274AEC|nr:GAF domain-containing SpoIIE family protein phosphatase [Solirubrobacter soli]
MQRATIDRISEPRRLRAVRASGLLDTGPEEAFDRLAQLAATLLDAPHAFITLVDDRRSFWKSAIGVDASDPVERQNAVEESFCQYVIESERALLVGDTASDPLTRANPSIEKLGVVAWAGVPLRGPEGEVLGSFCVLDRTTRSWSARDHEVLETLSESATREIALRAALAAERETRREADLVAAGVEELARTLQESLLPPLLPDTPGLEIAARYHPAGAGVEVVGDFYDVFQSGREAWNIVIGDVTGKGVNAARMTALAHYTLRAAAMRTDRPSAVLETLNRAMLEQAPPEDPRFLTALYLSFTPTASSVSLTMCSAGHDPPLLKRAGGGETTFIELRGTLLGAVPDPRLDDVEIELAAGDQLLLYTDGATDVRRRDERFGSARLHDVVAASAAATADDLADAVERAVLEFNEGALPDDTAILALVANPSRPVFW